ncbi:hypothetical protein OIU77_027324 [Salix suchowensis]|uniref:NAC domain-containing protein n=1 Tax=Salix suchowensis TaxID=1278906 RepID=A0ABQ9BP80_9ROSI|nr:hypothetical protein OIU77_027324 [Salix suchowensis]
MAADYRPFDTANMIENVARRVKLGRVCPAPLLPGCDITESDVIIPFSGPLSVPGTSFKAFDYVSPSFIPLATITPPPPPIKTDFVDDYFKKLPPGYRFCPFDGELVVHYLANKVNGLPLPWNKIADVTLYEHNPEYLAGSFIGNPFLFS